METSAWQKRGYERQELVRELMRRVYDKEDEIKDADEKAGNVFLLNFALALVDHLKLRRTGMIVSQALNASSVFTDKSIFQMLDEVLAETDSFARSDAERDMLIVHLLEKILGSIASMFQSPLGQEEMLEPEKIFHARSAGKEVSIDDLDDIDEPGE